VKYGKKNGKRREKMRKRKGKDVEEKRKKMI
jgi:hypothetical protein